MSFDEALIHLKQGKSVYRDQWKCSKDITLGNDKDNELTELGIKYIVVHTTNGICSWTHREVSIPIDDILANDWKIFQ